jgi:hypothetical protein
MLLHINIFVIFMSHLLGTEATFAATLMFWQISRRHLLSAVESTKDLHLNDNLFGKLVRSKITIATHRTFRISGGSALSTNKGAA